jgi:4-amino-4-deoxy-L-arabinose transferase-like glycosyltransferase
MRAIYLHLAAPRAWLAFALGCVALLYLASLLFRPLMPVDETRYLTVAWEMTVRNRWLAPLTLNFEPYTHKPPLLFWLIALSWKLFGTDRWAAALPAAAAAGASLALTAALARRLFPHVPGIAARAPLVLAGTFLFLVYSTLMMFDFLLADFVMAALLCFLACARPHGSPSPARAAACVAGMGFFLGLAVLTKGPVAYLYILPPILLGGRCRREGWRGWYRPALAGIALSLLPVLCWLVPVLRGADGNFAFWLLWEQSAGRVTGSFPAAHPRPFYFYFGILPLLFLPWALLPEFWRGLSRALRPAPGGSRALPDEPGFSFLLNWLAPVFICFCLIRGKQAHYLVPLLPAAAILTASRLREARPAALAGITAALVLALSCGQAVCRTALFPRYDWRPVAAFVKAHPGHDWAFVENYHGEIGFLARLEKPVADIRLRDLDSWFAGHPDGYAVIRYDSPQKIRKYQPLLTMHYRSENVGIFHPCPDCR